MTDKPTVTGTGWTYFAAAVTSTNIVALPGEICGHAHRSRHTAANCARRMHKRLGKNEPTLRAYTMKVGPDGYCDTPVRVL